MSIDFSLDKDISVLIVEDETFLALGIEHSLKKFDYSISGIETTADNAISHALTNYPDIIIMDIKLKGDKTGIDAAKVIWNRQKIPIIFLTSYSDDKTIKDAMASEPYGYLVKPFNEKELSSTIKIALHKHNYFFKNKETLKKELKNLIELECGFTFDKVKNLLLKDKEIVKLTGNEVKLFNILTDYPGQPISFERISSFIWRSEECDIGNLRGIIFRIKSKLGVNLIENIYDMGYIVKVK